MSINKRVTIEYWYNSSGQLICKRIFAIIGKYKYFTLDQWPVIQALLMKFSPIWHTVKLFHLDGGVGWYDYLYQDGSFICAYAGSSSIEVNCNRFNLAISQTDEIYDKLLELDLISAEAQHVH